MKKTIEISNRLADMMRTDDAHLATTLERFAYLLRVATKENEDTFNDREWALMAHATEAARFDPRLGPVETLAGSVEQEARLEGLDTWYHVDLDALLTSIRQLDTVQAWAVVEALTIAQLPHVDKEHDQWWTVAGRKPILAEHAAGKRRRNGVRKANGNGMTATVLTQSVAPASAAAREVAGNNDDFMTEA